MTQILTNRRRRMLTFVLPHDEFCKDPGACVCTKSRRPERLVPSALTLPALATIEAPDAVLLVKEVQSAIRRVDVTATPKPNPAAIAHRQADEAGDATATPVETTPHPTTEIETPQRQPKKRARE